mmetsp:Transcript_5574/g.8547  ORF Transcript_5574/g.8547 Transcript_5574/m.8547 type:complete len:222 (+) Transcript_5574:673-1338(+)
MPCLFFTVSPDSSQSFQISVFAMQNTEKCYDEINEMEFTDDELLLKLNLRNKNRIEYPGICEQEYIRVIDHIIFCLFKWDMKEKKSLGIGLFGEVEAFCLANEEQGRKDLHGHFIIFIKGWNNTMKILQKKDQKQKSFVEAEQNTIAYFNNIASANLFSTFDEHYDNKNVVNPFFHDNCKRRYQNKPSHCAQKNHQINIQCVSPLSLKKMRNKTSQKNSKA